MNGFSLTLQRYYILFILKTISLFFFSKKVDEEEVFVSL